MMDATQNKPSAAVVKPSIDRRGRELLRATLPFVKENRARSWYSLLSTVGLMLSAQVAAGALPWWPLQAIVVPFAALLMVRAFILFHDYMHGAILQGSLMARGILYFVGAMVMVPPRSWRYSHNFHHAHVGQLEASSVGSFPMLTVAQWQKATLLQRVGYRMVRSPLVIMMASATVFLWSVCLGSFIREPRRYWDSLLVVLFQAALMTSVGMLFGWQVLCCSVLLPEALAALVGAYLFYAQHNTPGLKMIDDAVWTPDVGALQSSSYMKLPAIMHWFTGNIGYHHVHHLNPAVPFYRLPEAMAAVFELQAPVVTTLGFRDILASLRLKLWDEGSQQMVSFRQAARLPFPN
ncbi:MAG: fatty acid desaturase [Planctomycetes bacterium]|nr:fatty acid desaturase [Planctomycetota bacterium]